MKTPVLITTALNAVSNSANRYLAPVGGASGSTTGQTRVPIAEAGTLSQLTVRLGTPLAQGQYVFKVFKNGVEPVDTLTVTLAAGGAPQVATDSAHTVAVAAGEDIMIQCSPSGSPDAQSSAIQIGMVFEASAPEKSVIAAYHGSTAASVFVAPGVIVSGGAESVIQTVAPTSGSIGSLFARRQAAPGAGASVAYSLRVNGVSHLTATINGAATTASASGAVTVNAGDLICIQAVSSSSPAPAASSGGIGLSWTPDVAGESLVFASALSGLTNAADRYLPACGNVAQAAEPDSSTLAPAGLALKKLHARVSAAPGVGKSWAFTLRKGGADQTLATTIAGTDTTNEDIVNAVSLAAGDLFDSRVRPTGTPAGLSGLSVSMVATGGPVVADQTLDFGRLTRAGAGGIAPKNTGTPIMSASRSGTNANHWDISSDGTLTPSEQGQDNLLPSYTLTCTFSNDSGADTAVITINTEADAADVASGAQLTTITGSLGYGSSISTPKTIYLREGVNYGWSTAWFSNKTHSAMLSVKARTRRTATLQPPSIEGGTFFANANNFTFEGIVFEHLMLRRSMGPSAALKLSATPGRVVHNDCEFKGNLSSLAPGFSQWGFYIIPSNVTSMNSFDFEFNDCDFHDTERPILFTNPKGVTSPGPTILFDGCDIWNFGNDGLTLSGFWRNPRVVNTRIHSPYIDRNRVYFYGSAARTWKRTTAWTGATNSKKLLLTVHGDFEENTDGFSRTIYAEGGATTPTLELWREATTARIHFTVRSAAGAELANLVSTSAIGGAGTEQMTVVIDIDTDRPTEGVRFHLWREKDLGGGEWETMTANTNGELLNLTAGSISFSGRFDGTKSGGGSTHYFHCKRFACWYGQALGQTSDRTAFISDTTGLLGAWSTLQSAYGDPTVRMEGGARDWETNGNMGTGGPWTTQTGLNTGHGDGIQTLYGQPTTDQLFENVIVAAFKDQSPKYDRPNDPTHQFYYRDLQLIFQEDQGANVLNVRPVIRNVLVAGTSNHAISLYNGQGGMIDGCAAFWLESFGAAAPDTYPPIRSLIHGSAAGGGGNTLSDNWAHTVASQFGNDTISGPVTNDYIITTEDTPATVDELLAYAVGKGAIQDLGQ